MKLQTTAYMAILSSILALSGCAIAPANTISSNMKLPIDKPVADVVIRADITDPSAFQPKLYDMWNTINRIAPKNGVSALDGLHINTVRMLGGITKKDSEGNKVPDLEYDTATYNPQTNSYE